MLTYELSPFADVEPPRCAHIRIACEDVAFTTIHGLFAKMTVFPTTISLLRGTMKGVVFGMKSDIFLDVRSCTGSPFELPMYKLSSVEFIPIPPLFRKSYIYV